MGEQQAALLLSIRRFQISGQALTVQSNNCYSRYEPDHRCVAKQNNRVKRFFFDIIIDMGGRYGGILLK